jgi:diacylglycerol kinase (ATP)
LARTVALQPCQCPIRIDNDADVDRRPALFLAFGNSRFTGGRLLLTPRADTADGLVDVLRCGPIGRLQILRHVPKLLDGSHLALPFVSSRQARCVEFELNGAQPVSVDGDVVSMQLERLDVLPSAIRVLV